MICDLVARDVQVCYQCKVGIRNLGIVCELWRAPVGVFSLADERVDSVYGV